VLRYFSSRRNWDSPNPSPAGECALPPLWYRGEGHTRWRERGWESPNSDEGTYTVVLCIVYVLCGQNGPHSWCDRGWGGPQMYNHILPYPCHIQVFLFHTHKAVKHQSFNYLIQYPPPPHAPPHLPHDFTCLDI
jgi:hypothetical protein